MMTFVRNPALGRLTFFFLFMSSASFVKYRLVPSFIYCIVFACKIKEIFSDACCFFADFFEKSYWKRQQIYQKQQIFYPELPDRPQPRREKAKKQDHPACSSQNHIAPQFTLAALQHKQKQYSSTEQTIDSVQNMRHAG